MLLIGISHNLKVSCQLGIINRRSTCEILEQEQNLSQNLSSEARIIQLKLQKIERRQELWEVNDLAVGFHLHIERIVVNFFFTSLLFFIFVDFKFEVGESSVDRIYGLFELGEFRWLVELKRIAEKVLHAPETVVQFSVFCLVVFDSSEVSFVVKIEVRVQIERRLLANREDPG